MRKVLYAVLLTGLFLLMLSALVVTPEAADAQPPVRMPLNVQAVFLPAVSTAVSDPAHLLSNRPDMRVMLSLVPVLLLCAALIWGVRDANGHVLTAVRYENSVYQVFHPEVAGG